MKNYLFVLILIANNIASCSIQPSTNKYSEISIVPKPAKLELTNNPTYIDKNTAILFDENNEELVVAAN